MEANIRNPDQAAPYEESDVVAYCCIVVTKITLADGQAQTTIVMNSGKSVN